MKKKIYYAHFKGIYNTLQEERDIAMISRAFPDYEILNPNKQIHQDNCKKFENPMEYFERLVAECEILVFRGCVNGKIGAGVYKEILFAQQRGMPVFELPSFLNREMTVDETRLMLSEMGLR